MRIAGVLAWLSRLVHLLTKVSWVEGNGRLGKTMEQLLLHMVSRLRDTP